MLLNRLTDKIYRKSPKIFCIGVNKTGTTSIETALSDFGFKLGNQTKGQMLLKDYKKRDFYKIINFCKTADAFQDAPFSYNYTFIPLDQYFINAKFILSVRDSSEQWYNSVINYHSKRFGDGKLPTVKQLKEVKRTSTRSVWNNFQMRFNVTESAPYDRNTLINYYESHNNMVRDYFRFKDNFLEINLSHPYAYSEFCKFLKKKPLYNKFPWENKTVSL